MRKVIQISTAGVDESGNQFGVTHVTTALCDDGSVWEKAWPMNNHSGDWYRLPPIPQDDDA